MRRITLFVLTNLLIIAVVSVSFSVIGSFLSARGVDISLYQQAGINYTGLLIFCTIFGIGGAMISLLLSKTIAKSSMRVKLIDPIRASSGEKDLINMVAELAKAADIAMPEVGIFPSAQANAFATGWNKNKALVAVSAGMLRDFDKREVRAVMAHEVGHIANGDMVTLALIQGVINVFVLFAARVVAFFVDKFVLRREGGGIGMGYFITVLAFDMIFGILASTVVCAFSRWREYRADSFAAVATSPADMIAALRRLQSAYDQPSEITDSLVAFGIKGKKNKFLSLLATHPPLEKRIAALEKAAPFIS
ncbi:MAG: protease HtpX [Candidatus Portiera sp.]|nr:protease HtpX [Portiera sp.]